MTASDSQALPVHVRIEGYPVRDNCLVVDGRKLSDIAADIGQTPFYLYSRALMTARVEKLRQALPEGIEIHYAIKANPMPEVIRHLAGLVDGLDVASAGELKRALATGMDPACISFAGPGKTSAELEQAVAAGIIINCESRAELGRILKVSQQLGRQAQVAIRVNPDFELKASGMKMGGGPKPFGIDAEQVPAILEEMQQLDVAFKGFHIFSGSQNLNADSIVESAQKSLALALKLAEHAPCAPEIINIGGGLGIPYFPGDKPLDLAPIGACLVGLQATLRKRYPQCRLVLELGRYLVGEAGIYVCRVIERKESRGEIFLITDGGMHHHLAASGNFGQVIRRNYPVLIGNRVHSDEPETVTIVGPLCTPLDMLARQSPVAAASEGDLVVVLQSGAYGATASPSGFLSHPAVVEALL